MMKIVVLNRLRNVVRGELRAELRETRRKLVQPADLVLLERQLAVEETLVTYRQGRNAQVRDAVGKMLVRVRSLATLELGAERHHCEPCLGRVSEHADRCARVGKKEPRPLLVVPEHPWKPVGPAGEELGSKARLERLDRRARLEPRDTDGEWHAEDRRPRAVVRRLDRADRVHVRADPVLGGGSADVSEVSEPNAHPASNTEGVTADRRDGHTVAQVR